MILLKILHSSRIKLSELKHQLIRQRSIVLQQSHTITREASPVLPPQRQLLRLILQLSIVLRQNLIITRGLFLALQPRHLLLQLHIALLNTVPRQKVTIIRGRLLARHLPHLQPQLTPPHSIVRQLRATTTQCLSIAHLSRQPLQRLPQLPRLTHLRNIAHRQSHTITLIHSIALQRQQPPPLLHIRVRNTAHQLRATTIPGHSFAQ